MKPNAKRLTKLYYITAVFALVTHPISLSFYLMPKMSKSWLSGLPTPWNLKSELAWEKSHRFAGFSLTIVAILTFLSALSWRFIFNTPLFPSIVILGGLAISALGVFIVSYYVYHQEKYYKSKQVKQIQKKRLASKKICNFFYRFLSF